MALRPRNTGYLRRRFPNPRRYPSWGNCKLDLRFFWRSVGFSGSRRRRGIAVVLSLRTWLVLTAVKCQTGDGFVAAALEAGWKIFWVLLACIVVWRAGRNGLRSLGSGVGEGGAERVEDEGGEAGDSGAGGRVCGVSCGGVGRSWLLCNSGKAGNEGYGCVGDGGVGGSIGKRSPKGTLEAVFSTAPFLDPFLAPFLEPLLEFFFDLFLKLCKKVIHPICWWRRGRRRRERRRW